jgi:hypothetical protein
MSSAPPPPPPPGLLLRRAAPGEGAAEPITTAHDTARLDLRAAPNSPLPNLRDVASSGAGEGLVAVVVDEVVVEKKEDDEEEEVEEAVLGEGDVGLGAPFLCCCWWRRRRGLFM